MKDTLEEAIEHCKEVFESCKTTKDKDCAWEHLQLQQWLEELLDWRLKNGMPPSVPKSDCGWVLRYYDSYDHHWIDICKKDTEGEIIDAWNKETNHGTKDTQHSDGQYYAILPADTKTIFD